MKQRQLISLQESENDQDEGPRRASLLLESVIVKNGSRADVILIESGWSSNGKFYSEQVLREAIPLFERTPISVYGFGSDAKHLNQGYRDFAPGFTSNIAGLQADLAARPEAVAWREQAEADGFRGLEDL
jgi:hypothetical protein